MTPLHVAGIGFWRPGVSNAAALLAGKNDPAVAEPPCALLPSRLARRASLLTRMTIEAAGQAAGEAGIDIATLPTVFASSRGEIQTLRDLLEMLHGDGMLSPTRFHNSVYNAAAGQFSVAVQNRELSTTLVVGNETVPMALFEAFCLAEERRLPAVLAVVADEQMALPWLESSTSQSLAAAICLTREPLRAGVPSLSCPARDAARVPDSFAPLLADPVSCILPLLTALRTSGFVGRVDLQTPEGWSVGIQRSR